MHTVSFLKILHTERNGVEYGHLSPEVAMLAKVDLADRFDRRYVSVQVSIGGQVPRLIQIGDVVFCSVRADRIIVRVRHSKVTEKQLIQ
jgi:hypothetical protein